MDELIDEWWAQILKERRCSSTSKTVKAILTYPRVEQELAYEHIPEHIRNSIREVRECKDVNKTVDLCAAINACFDNFSYASDSVDIAFNDVINFIDVTIDDCKQMLPISDRVQMRKVKWLELIHYLARILVLVLKQRRPLKLKKSYRIVPGIEPYDKKVLFGLSYKLSYFFKVKEILMDTKCTLAMASMLIREILVQDQQKLIEFHKSFLATLPREIEETDYERNVYKFLLGNAILNTWTGTLIDAASTEVYLRFFIQLCESYSSDTGIILNISRTLLLLIKNKCFTDFMNDLYRDEFNLVKPLLSCTYMLLDHPVPCIRHSAKDFPKLLTRFRQFQLSIIDSLPVMMLTDNRSYFICLSALAKAVGSEPIIADNDLLRANLFEALRDSSLVTYVIDALHAIILNDYLTESNFRMWCQRWIVPLLYYLHCMRSTAAPEIEKLLQSLLMKYPKIISFVINKWDMPKNDEELRYIMTALKVYNKLSTSHQEESCIGLKLESDSDSSKEQKWKGLISTDLLLRCLCHNDDDVRVSAYSLVVETCKTTEIYTRKDFELIKDSLMYNLNNQEPATRQKFLSLVRKMMLRYVDGLAVIEKQVEANPEGEAKLDKYAYEEFRKWLFEFGFCNIYQNANYNRLHTILSILLDYVDIIKQYKFTSVTLEDSLRRLIVPLKSSYEENKKMAVQLSKKLKILESYKDTTIVRTLFQSAFELCGKIEPPNVLTGAYLIQFILQYSALRLVVRKQAEGISTCSMEHLITVLLSNKLETQIRRAEKNLIKAVTDNSMYGTLFTIRLVLQETDFSSVTDAPESEHRTEVQRYWSEALRKLIDFSFRMIKVVSCVVNSSSPEGHLPSDFQTNLDLACQNSHQPLEEEDEEPAEKNRKPTLSNIRKIALCEVKYPRTRAIMVQDTDRILTYYNNVFLSIGESRSFTDKNAVVFDHILTETTKLISEMEAIEEPTDEESRCLECLKLAESRVRNCIAMYEDYNLRHDKPTAQMLLLCSWRSIKEACLFLGDLISKLPLETWIESGLLTEEIILTIGVELRKLLCEIKHRGAFEHAYVGFTSLITAFWKCPIKNLNELPQKWLEEIISEIQQPVEDQKIKFCSNRRSAGLPFLVQAIICTELKCTNSAKILTLDNTMNTLLAVAEDDKNTEESIIHSLNILRALFKHALLGEHVAPYVCRGVMIAIRGSRAPVWGIRNSACLLFSALMIRIFGVARDKDVLSKKNRMTAKHFFQRYPDLYQFFLNEMELEFDITVDGLQPATTFPSPQPHLFLILLILGRLYSSPVEDKADIDFSEFLPYINASCCHPTYKIRELGARALVPLISSDVFIEAMDRRFSSLYSQSGHNNQQQGTLFQIKNILLEICDRKKLYEGHIQDRTGKWMQKSNKILDVEENETPYLIKIIYAQILHLLFKNNVHIGELIYELLGENDDAEIMVDGAEDRKKIPGRSAYLETLNFVRFDIAAHLFTVTGDNHYMMQSFYAMLNSKDEEVVTVILVFLKYISSSGNDDIPVEEEYNIVSVKLQDMLCIQDKKKLNAISREIFSNQGVINYLMYSFMTLLQNANNPEYLYKMESRLTLSVFSNFLLNGFISAQDIYVKCIPEVTGGPLMELLSEIIKCYSPEISVGAFTCFGVLFFENIRNGIPLTKSTILYFRRLAFSYSEADADVRQKMALCEIFVTYYDCFTHNFFKEESHAMSIWMLPIRLLSDEDPRIRREIMEMVYRYQDFCRENNQHRELDWDFDDIFLSKITGTPYKAQETLVECYISVTPTEDLIHLFVPMFAFMLSAYISSMKSDFTTKQNEDGVFEKGTPNPFCEDMTLGKLLCGKLKKFRTFVKILFAKRMEQKHIDSLKEFFPSLILVDFPPRLLEFCTEIVKILIEEYPTSITDVTPVSFLPLFIADLMSLWETARPEDLNE